MSTVENTPRVAGAGDAEGAGLRVPWSTVLPLASVAAFGNGFWLIVVRGAVGAIERTGDPFTGWLRESALLLPLYVFAVLAALTLALRWFGPDPLRARSAAATLLLVVLASTLAGSGVQAVSAVYDYRLETAQVMMTTSHMLSCDSVCVADQQQSTLFLQMRALGLNAAVMLASNLILLGLVVAFRGGRLDVASRRRSSTCLLSFVRPSRPLATRSGARPQADDQPRVCDLDDVLVAGLLAAAAIHATVIREHLTEWPAAGVFFILLTISQMAAATLVLVRLRPAALLATVTLSVGPILLWLYSRTAGLPFGPDAGVPEPVGLTDAAASLVEAVTLVLAFLVLSPRRRPRRPRIAQHLITLALVGVIALAVVGVSGGLGLFGGDGGMNVGPAYGP